MKFEGTRYNSRWDFSTWLILFFVAMSCMWVAFIDDWLIPVILTVVFVAFFVVAFKGTYYRIDGNNLVVYQFFQPTALPIDKISEIKPTKSILSSPATSLTHRLAIKFSDRKVLKSCGPLIISPVRQEEFINQLVSINPNIRL